MALLPGFRTLVERRRKLGDRVFRLWAEDLDIRKGVRVHALDAVSLARASGDICDADVQAMFDDYWKRRARRGWSSMPYNSNHHDELCEFLSCLLDGLFLELNQNDGEVTLRIPSAVQPRIPPPDIALVEVPQVLEGFSVCSSADDSFMRPTCSRATAMRRPFPNDELLASPPPSVSSLLVVPSAVIAGKSPVAPAMPLQRRRPASARRHGTGIAQVPSRWQACSHMPCGGAATTAVCRSSKPLRPSSARQTIPTGRPSSAASTCGRFQKWGSDGPPYLQVAAVATARAGDAG
mmetsp:Transcript_85995/g.223526  ORF Transcript_85995/g.223526 Transcript_85995/m.223526 type:complete len:293 (-) Transcript_85995:71-949(-)